ncbi:Astra associated protein 1 Asa1 [Diatrype stigma]|uniref:ASTRA-associated protein 1 n=1 Tax=Diatrype stigma TaxID=117547 RepID=A0AAN9YNZ7_9PEZI
MTSQRPAAQPKSVLRGHKAQVHSAAFIRHNQRLASGDAEGFVVLWDLTIMRPRAVWRAHQSAILGIEGWGDDKVITHGRDNRLIVWKLGEGDEAALSTALPLDQSVSDRRQPWVLHILEVNTMNFCSFASCPANPDLPASSEELLVAVPNTLSTEAIESKGAQIGMVMTLSLFWLEGFLTLVAAYENGLAMVARLGRNSQSSWEVIYKTQCHSQPILSLDVPSNRAYFLTSGADAIIAKHPIPHPHADLLGKQKAPGTNKSKSPHIPSSSDIPESSKSHDKKPESSATSPSLSSPSPSALSSALASEPNPPRSPEASPLPLQTAPLKTVNTKHAGQQGLRIRSDGKIFATAGWDAKVRVYSTKTLAELAVLKWHGMGCYAIAFAMVDGGGGSGEGEHANEDSKSEDGCSAPEQGVAPLSKARTGGELSVKDRRLKQAREAHWLAAGSKDGRISLWDIY